MKKKKKEIELKTKKFSQLYFTIEDLLLDSENKEIIINEFCIKNSLQYCKNVYLFLSDSGYKEIHKLEFEIYKIVKHEIEQKSSN